MGFDTLFFDDTLHRCHDCSIVKRLMLASYVYYLERIYCVITVRANDRQSRCPEVRCPLQLRSI